MYRLLLLLLPPQRRAMYGAEMNDVFVTLCAHARQERGWVGVIATWMKEALGMTKFAWRERGGGSPDVRLHETRGPRPFNHDEWRWAWRGVRARGWRTVFVVLLFGLALGANAVVFAAADAFVFRTLPYDRPDGLVVMQRSSRGLLGVSDYTYRDAIFEWRKHTDLFAGVHAHDRGASAYLTADGSTEVVRAQRVTPGMFELLGVLPAIGRPFLPADAVKGAPPVVVISDALARRLFGGADLAVGQTFFTGTDTPEVIGVMAPAFRFPTAAEQIWRPLDLETQPYNSGVAHIARLAPGVTLDEAAAAVTNRLPAVAAVVPEDSRRLLNRAIRDKELSLNSLAGFRRQADVSLIFSVLVGAAVSLLLIACANVVSLELASASSRLRTLSVQSALGATRASLVRVCLLEGGLLMVLSAATATGIALWGTGVLSDQLTVSMREALANPVDVDLRALALMVGLAAMAWVMTVTPTLVRVSSLSVVSGLRHDPRTMPVSRAGARTRQWLMTSQVALTVLLLVGALLYIRTYEARVGLDKGLDASAVATLQVYQAPDGKREPAELEAELLARLRGLPGVLAVARTWNLPPSTQSGASGPIRINGDVVDTGNKWTMVSHYSVDPDYFRVMSITLLSGQFFDATSRPEHVVIDERFARTFWPNSSPLGSRFRIGSTGIAGVSEYEVIGVSRQMRADRLETPEGGNVFVSYIRLSKDSAPLTFVAKLDDERRLPMIGEAASSVAPRLVVRTDTIEARYRRLEGNTRLAAAITGAFGAVAWIVATAGIFAVMAFLVSGRTREIGIRMALGADRGNVLRMVFGSSLRFVVIGTALGLTAAAIASQYISTQLFGVTPTDPLTYAGVAALVITTAALATWWPARQAARVDPAITLRAE
ncbi:MAG: ABC transporter permease [Acidobacteria bacterium]|nr:ABC transporter permease [Acidobacteriota bacterium]